VLTTTLRRALVAASATALIGPRTLAAAPAAVAAPPLRPIGTSAAFPHFAVTVQDTAMNPEYHGYLVKLRVCVRSLPPGSTGGRTRISWDPWTVTAGGRTHRPSGLEDPPPDMFPRPYASEGRFRVGDCGMGWLPFRSVKAGQQASSVNYRNSLGDHARWRPGPAAVGTKATFPHFTVKVTAAESKDGYFGVRATTCVRSVPAGRRTGPRVLGPLAAADGRGQRPPRDRPLQSLGGLLPAGGSAGQGRVRVGLAGVPGGRQGGDLGPLRQLPRRPGVMAGLTPAPIGRHGGTGAGPG